VTAISEPNSHKALREDCTHNTLAAGS